MPSVACRRRPVVRHQLSFTGRPDRQAIHARPIVGNSARLPHANATGAASVTGRTRAKSACAQRTASSCGGNLMARRRSQSSNARSEQEQRQRDSAARRSLSGSCAGDYPSTTTVKEKPRRQSTGTRLSVALSHGEREPRPPVCAHDPLNDCRASGQRMRVSASHCTSHSGGWRQWRRSLHKPPGSAVRTRSRCRTSRGTSCRLSAFQ